MLPSLPIQGLRYVAVHNATATKIRSRSSNRDFPQCIGSHSVLSCLNFCLNSKGLKRSTLLRNNLLPFRTQYCEAFKQYTSLVVHVIYSPIEGGLGDLLRTIQMVMFKKKKKSCIPHPPLASPSILSSLSLSIILLLHSASLVKTLLLLTSTGHQWSLCEPECFHSSKSD